MDWIGGDMYKDDEIMNRAINAVMTQNSNYLYTQDRTGMGWEYSIRYSNPLQ